VFGPILHVLRYRREQLEDLVNAINATGYGLTMGIHSRIDETIEFIASHAHVGNIYVNRNIIGAVVGVQPFGGEGKSGTGPKAGGPLYLKRLLSNSEPDFGNTYTNEPELSPAFTTLVNWIRNQGYQQIARLGEHYARASLYGKNLSCPGPTGERNTLGFAARGLVWCVADADAVLLNQLLAVLASGNTPVLQKNSLTRTLPADIHAALHFSNNDDVPSLAIALAQTSLAGNLRQQLAARGGAIVPVIETDADSAIPIWRLNAERALCINTAAAGGNASLMTLGN
jgi:RHH-type proline utilization regulon transcriptional repressor/proline dehydrogenase/delta 1-pyrroline-5-carboxylate dehydrogenase